MPDRDAPAESWHPRLGQRVRIRRSGACRSAHHLADGSDDGRTGVIADQPWPAWQPHPYLVRFDQPLPSGVVWQRYTAAELEDAP